MTMLQVIMASAAVIGLIYVTMRVLRGYMQSTWQSRNIRILEAISIGRKAQLVLVRVQDRQMVLGVSEAGVTRLMDLEHPLEQFNGLDEDNPRSFRDRLEEWWQRADGCRE